jgi:hypothetical protein
LAQLVGGRNDSAINPGCNVSPERFAALENQLNATWLMPLSSGSRVTREPTSSSASQREVIRRQSISTLWVQMDVVAGEICVG